MASMNIHLEGDAAWPDLQGKEVIHITGEIGVAALSSGMTSGRPSVAFRIDLPDGRVVVAETSMRLFQTAYEMFAARYGKVG